MEENEKNEYYEKVSLKDRAIESFIPSIFGTVIVYIFFSGMNDLLFNNLISHNMQLFLCSVFFVCAFVYRIIFVDTQYVLTENGIRKQNEEIKKKEAAEEKRKIEMLYAIKIGTSYVWGDFNVTRVPSGWMFEKQYHDSSDKGKMIFVPETKDLESVLLEKSLNYKEHNI